MSDKSLFHAPTISSPQFQSLRYSPSSLFLSLLPLHSAHTPTVLQKHYHVSLSTYANSAVTFSISTAFSQGIIYSLRVEDAWGEGERKEDRKKKKRKTKNYIFIRIEFLPGEKKIVFPFFAVVLLKEIPGGRRRRKRIWPSSFRFCRI